MASEAEDGKEWFFKTASALARAMGVPRPTVGNWTDRGLPKIVENGKTTGYDLRQVIRWWAENANQESTPGRTIAEQKLQEETWKKRADRLEREGELIPKIHVQQQYTLLAGAFRTAADHITKNYGNEAGQIILDAIEEVEQYYDGILNKE